MFIQLLKQIRHRPFARSVSWSFLGSGGAQAVILIGTLIPLFKLYDPAQFGVFGIYLAIAMIASTLSTGRYEVLVPVPKSDRDAMGLFTASIGLGFISCLVISGVLLLWIPGWLESLGGWIALLPCQVFLMACCQSQREWLARRHRFGVLAFAEFLRAFVLILVQCLLADSFGPTAVGLVIGLLAGWGAFWLWTVSICVSTRAIGGFSLLHAVSMIRSHRRNLFLLPSQGLNRVTSNMPIFALEMVFGSSVAGGYVMAAKFLYGPQAMVSEALRTVYFPYASKTIALTGQCRQLFDSVLKLIVIIGILLFIPMSLLAPWFISWIAELMGEAPDKWEVTGQVVQVLAPFYILQIANGPIAGMWVIAGRQAMLLVWEIGLLLLVTIGLLLGWPLDSLTWSLVGYGIAKTIAFAINIYACSQFARGRWLLPTDERSAV